MSTLLDLYRKGNLGAVEELIVKVGNYAWEELTLLQQGELKELAAAELDALRVRAETLEERNRWWVENYDITMPCGHKNRYLKTTDNGETERDINGDCICVMCELEN